MPGSSDDGYTETSFLAAAGGVFCAPARAAFPAPPMVSVNVSQLLKSPPGTVRDMDFSESLPDPANDLHLRGPVSGHLRLLRTSRGVLASSQHHALASMECARCLDEVNVEVEGSFEEEFLPSLDLQTGLPAHAEGDAEDVNYVNEHHEIDVDDFLRQSILTGLPLAPLCDAACPGLCPTCGQRLDERHAAHQEVTEPAAPPDVQQPFASLADLLREKRRETDTDGT